MSVGVIQCFYLAPGAPEEKASCCQGSGVWSGPRSPCRRAGFRGEASIVL